MSVSVEGEGRVFGRVHCSDSDPVGGGKAATTLVSTSPSPLPSFNKFIKIASIIFGSVKVHLFQVSRFVEYFDKDFGESRLVTCLIIYQKFMSLDRRKCFILCFLSVLGTAFTLSCSYSQVKLRQTYRKYFRTNSESQLFLLTTIRIHEVQCERIYV